MTRAGDRAVSQEKVAADFDRFQASYTDEVDRSIAFSGLTSDFFVARKCDYLLRLAARHLGAPGTLKVLDVGCGIGSYHPHLAGAFASLSGVDVSERSIEQARRGNPRVAYETYPGGVLPFDDAAFDLAFTSCVMHHVPVQDWTGFVAEMARVLRPGGLAVVFEHNPHNPVTRHVVRTCPIDVDAVLLPPRRTRALFTGAGFAEVATRSIFSIPPVRRPLLPIDEALGRLGLGAQYYLTARKPG